MPITKFDNSRLNFNVLTLATPIASTSGTSIDFTGIPSGMKRIMVILSGVSTNGSSLPLIRLGTSGGIQSSGYASGATNQASSIVVASSSTAGFLIGGTSAAGHSRSGIAILTLVDSSSNSWVFSYSGTTEAAESITAAGRVSLSGVLDRIRVTTTNGTDAFDAGTINIMYE